MSEVWLHGPTYRDGYLLDRAHGRARRLTCDEGRFEAAGIGVRLLGRRFAAIFLDRSGEVFINVHGDEGPAGEWQCSELRRIAGGILTRLDVVSPAERSWTPLHLQPLRPFLGGLEQLADDRLGLFRAAIQSEGRRDHLRSVWRADAQPCESPG